ncbi:MAG: hypothetical protein ACK5QS_01015 [Pseudanabaenaceae cyanobacterium]
MTRQVDSLPNFLTCKTQFNNVALSKAVLSKVWQRVAVVSTSMIIWMATGISEVTAQTSCPSGRARASLVPPTAAYVISPRHSIVLETTPLLKWHPISLPRGNGTPTYSIQVTTMQGEVIWSTETTQTEVRYNADGKGLRLMAGGEYILNIRVNLPPQIDKNLKYDDQELNQSASFQVITPQNKLFLENGLAAVSSRLLPQAENEFKSDIYANYGLNDAALNLLEKGIAQGGSASVLARLHYKTGLIYGSVGLWQLAQSHYEKGLNFATQGNQPDLVPAFQLQLVEAYMMQYSPANNRKSVEMLRVLLPYYEAKGEQSAIDYIRHMLDILQENITLEKT